MSMERERCSVCLKWLVLTTYNLFAVKTWATYYGPLYAMQTISPDTISATLCFLL